MIDDLCLYLVQFGRGIYVILDQLYTLLTDVMPGMFGHLRMREPEMEQ